MTLLRAASVAPDGLARDMRRRPSGDTGGRVTAPRAELALLALVLAAGAALRVAQWWPAHALWLDELALARNIVNRGALSLVVDPIDYDQTAPRGFLLLEKLAVELFGVGDRPFRILPLCFSLASLPLFWMVARRALDRSWSRLTATALFAIALPLVRYAAELKQYSGDVAIALALTLVALAVREPGARRRTYVAGAIAGAVAVALSQVAVIVLAGLGAALLCDLAARSRAMRRSVTSDPLVRVVLPVWALAAALVTVLEMRSMSPGTREFFRSFWFEGLLPPHPTLASAFRWSWARVTTLLGDRGLRFPIASIPGLVALVGVAELVRRRGRGGLLLVGPVAVAFVAAVARQYPWSGRLALFLLPAFLIALAAALELLSAPLEGHGFARAAAGSVAGMLLVAVALHGLLGMAPPYRKQDVHPALAHLRRDWRPGDVLYADYGAASAALFYGRRYGLDRSAVRFGACHRADPTAYLRELDAFRGRSRVWVLLIDPRPEFGGRRAVTGYLGTIGTARDSVIVTDHAPLPSDGVRLYLYDLSDASRLRRASASGYPVERHDAATPSESCAHGPAPLARSGRTGPLDL